MFTRDPKPAGIRWRDSKLDEGLIVRWGADRFDEEPLAAGVVGHDPSGRTVRRLLEEIDLDTHLVLTARDRCTTTKERFVGRAAGRHAHQIPRVDRESTELVGEGIEHKLMAAVTEQLGRHQAVLVSDYAKGVCTLQVLAGLIGKARACGIPVLVDPARITDSGRYHGASILTPNRAEAEGATGLRPVKRAFASAGYQVRMVHPFASKQFRQAADGSVETDDNDLAGIRRATVWEALAGRRCGTIVRLRNNEYLTLSPGGHYRATPFDPASALATRRNAFAVAIMPEWCRAVRPPLLWCTCDARRTGWITPSGKLGRSRVTGASGASA